MRMNARAYLRFVYRILLALPFIILPTFASKAELSRPELKCLALTPYYPGSGISLSRKVADDIAYLNPAMLRVEFIREFSSGGDHSINYCAYDYITDHAGERGIQILGILDYSTVNWSTKEEWATEAFRQRYVARVQEIVTHYHNRTHPIRHWEIWNEQDIALEEFNVRIEPEPYARLLIAAYEAIKAIDPAATVVLGGISPKGFFYSENYLSDLYATPPLQAYYTANGYYPFDVVACHPYPETFSSPDPALANVLNQEIKAVMNANGDRTKKVWLTELGWNSHYVSEFNQGRYLAESYELIESLTDPAFPQDPPYVERYFWFNYTDFGTIDLWGLWTSGRDRKKPTYNRYLALTTPGPEPPDDPIVPGENAPVAGSSDAALPVQVSAADLLEGLVGQIVAGGFHSASQGSVANFTNGLFESNGYVAVLLDYGKPALHLRYTFDTPKDLAEVRIFAGHTGDIGNRAFQSNDIYFNGALAVSELNSGNYEQLPPGGDAVSVVRWLPKQGETFVATTVTTLEIVFWCVADIGGGFRDRWDPCDDPQEDTDGLGSAVVAPIIKEIDVLGEEHTVVNEAILELY